MKPWVKGVTLAALQVGLVASLGAKLLYDRTTAPRVWVLTAPYDPALPIRGRYVSLQLVVDSRAVHEVTSEADSQPPQPVTVHVEGDRLVAEAKPSEFFDPSDLHVRLVHRQGRDLVLLDQPVAFFIPEHVPDPSRRPDGEELWVEVTVPRKGPPRPIRLGVRKGDADIVPLELR